MSNLIKILCIILFTSLTSCNNYIQQTNIVNKKNIKFPTKAFVKIYKLLTVKSCKTNENCKVGTFGTHGSGVSIGKIGKSSILLTAAHVCQQQLEPSFIDSVGEYNIRMEAQNIEGISRKAKIVNIVHNQKIDLCMLIAEDLDTEGVLLSYKKPKSGAIIYSMAAPAGIFHPPVVPLLSGNFSGDISLHTSLITMNVTYGASGSGVLNYDMELIGVLFATHPSFKEATLISTHESLMLFVNESFRKLGKDIR